MIIRLDAGGTSIYNVLNIYYNMKKGCTIYIIEKGVKVE